MGEIIDAHHHLWRYSDAEYGWISPEMGLLKRDYLPGELGGEMLAAGVDGAVVVQARQSMEETRWLLECAESSVFIRGVVGWAPLLDGSAGAALGELVGSPKLKGLRHVIQAEADDFILRDDFNAGISSMLGTGLVYDILIHERQLPYAIEFAQWHPGQRLVLDHVAKPKIRDRELEPWRRNLIALGKAENVCCKLSGMVTEADWNAWTLDDLRPYLDAALEAFGPERLMAGSDWPVCLVATGYKRWWDALREWLEALTPAERGLILGGTAQRVYRL